MLHRLNGFDVNLNSPSGVLKVEWDLAVLTDKIYTCQVENQWDPEIYMYTLMCHTVEFAVIHAGPQSLIFLTYMYKDYRYCPGACGGVHDTFHSHILRNSM